MTTRHIDQLIDHLANRYADTIENPHSRRIAGYWSGLVVGAHHALQASGARVGAAPTSVELDVIEAFRSTGGRPPMNSSGQPRKNWLATMHSFLTDRWF